MLEVNLEVLEDSVHNLRLHFWWNLLIEIEFLNNEVKVVHKCIMHVLFNIGVQVRRYIVWLVRSLNLLDPYVEQTQFLIDEALEVIRLLQHVVDAAHKEGEEAETDELQDHAEDVLIGRASSVVSVSNGRQGLQYEIN